MIGQTLGHYKILDKLGAGGMGEVYRAEDTTLKRQVALKVLPPDLAASQERLERFQREAESLAAVNHPNIVHVYSVEEDEGTHFLTMELVEGEPLSHLIRTGGMPLERIFQIPIPLADALATAHEKGVIHRDLKPANIMVNDEGRVKVLDFGLAKLRQEAEVPLATELPTEPLTEEGRIVGTIPYMSPQQVEGKPVDHRTDIFSLGVLLYETATGERPFQGDTGPALMSAILKDTPEPVSELKEDLPRHLGRIIHHCLEKNPERRIQSAKDVRNELEALREELKNGSIAAASGAIPAAPRERLPAAFRWIVLFAVVVVLGAALSAFLWWRDSSAPKLTESDRLLLIDFVNDTDDPVFDGALQQALAVKLRESPYLDVLSDQQVRNAMQLMDLSPDEVLTPEIGRELCERQGVKAMIGGRISSLGSHYIVALNASQCRTGEILALEQVEAKSKEDVLTAMGSAASRLRQQLGESLVSIQQFDTPVQNATTSSLEALRAFSLGVEQRQRGEQLAAVPFFERALELDQDFPLASARLGTIYSNLGEKAQAVDYTTRAFESRDRVSERERFYIASNYYGNVTGEIDKRIETLEVWRRAYPRDWIPPTNLAVSLIQIGSYERAAEAGSEAHRLAPDHAFPGPNLAEAYAGLGRFEEARALLDESIESGYSYAYGLSSRYEMAFMEEDEAALRRVVRLAAGTEAELVVLVSRAAAAASRGKLAEARQLSRRAVTAADRLGRREHAAQSRASRALWEVLFGVFGEATQQTWSALEIARNERILCLSALVLGLARHPTEAQRLVDELGQSFPSDTLVQAVYIPSAKAAVALGQRDSTAAIELLEASTAYENGNLAWYRSDSWVPPAYLRGQAYLMEGSGEEALAQFTQILRLRGIRAASPVHTLVYLGLARAHALAGQLTESRQAYEEFFALMKDADEGLPILLEARVEFADL